MPSYLYRYIIIPSLIVQAYLNASVNDCPRDQASHTITIGPQWIRVTRQREGGVKQSGNLFGGYFTYERLKRYGWYIGAEGSYARGSLKGSIEDVGNLHSKFKDGWIEGRFGYTFQQKAGRRLSFTPFIGLGYAEERNNFGSSSFLPIHFKTHFYYPSFGFRSSIDLCDNIIVAVNFRARIPYEPKCKVSNDPDNDEVNQKIGEKLQYRVELPLSYFIPCYPHWGVSLLPFYEYRPYGEHVNFPFDYQKTTLNLWGIGLGLAGSF